MGRSARLPVFYFNDTGFTGDGSAPPPSAPGTGYAEPRYTCNGSFQLTAKRGEILQNLLTSCAGRLSYSGGQYVIYPGAWIGPGYWLGVAPTTASGKVPSFAKCVVYVSAADASTDLTFDITQNGTSIFTAAQTITHATAAGTIVTITSLATTPTPVAANDKFKINITSGSSSWIFTAQLQRHVRSAQPHPATMQ